MYALWHGLPDYPKTRTSPELYPFIYCLTILGVFYNASVGFYRCTLFRILLCTFYAAFLYASFLNNTDVYL